MINRTVLMSDALNFSAEQAINPYYSDPHTDDVKAQAEHDSIHADFEQAGMKLFGSPPLQPAKMGFILPTGHSYVAIKPS